MFVIQSVEDLWNHIAYVRGYAPDLFPHRDFLLHNQQMNLDRAFEQLRRGVDVAYPEVSFAEKREHLNGILDRSYAAYNGGDDIAAAHLLNEFEHNIFKAE